MNTEKAVQHLNELGAQEFEIGDNTKSLERLEKKYAGLDTPGWVEILPEGIIDELYRLLMKFAEKALTYKLKKRQLLEVSENNQYQDGYFIDFFEPISTYEDLCKYKNYTLEAKKALVLGVYQVVDRMVCSGGRVPDDSSSDEMKESDQKPTAKKKAPAHKDKISGKVEESELKPLSVNLDIDLFLNLRKKITEDLKKYEIEFQENIHSMALKKAPHWEIQWRTEATEFIGSGKLKSTEDFKKQFGTFGLGNLKILVKEGVVKVDDKGFIYIN